MIIASGENRLLDVIHTTVATHVIKMCIVYKFYMIACYTEAKINSFVSSSDRFNRVIHLKGDPGFYAAFDLSRCLYS